MKKDLDSLYSEKKMAPEIKSELWRAITKALEDEILLMVKQFELKKIMYNIDEMNYEQLLEISSILGVNFDANVINSIQFLREEVRAIPFKIEYKDNIKSLDSFARSLGYLGQTYVYYHYSTSSAILRGQVNPLLLLPNHDVTKPIVQKSEYNFSGDRSETVKLDTGSELDSFIPWHLGESDSRNGTTHLGIEIFLNQIWNPKEDEENPNRKECLIPWKALDFISSNVEFARRAVVVPHIGCNTTFISNMSGVTDHIKEGEYTHPEIKTNVCIKPEGINVITELDDISYFEFGVGSHKDLPTTSGSGTFPTELNKKIARVKPYRDEKWLSSDWLVVNGHYHGLSVTNCLLHDSSGYKGNVVGGSGIVNGINNVFTGTLEFAPLKKKFVEFEVTYLGVLYSFKDDGLGNLKSDKCNGTIDYITGDYVLNFDFEYTRRITENITTEQTTYELVLPYSGEIKNVEGENHVSILYSTDKRYIAKDDGLGNITGEGIVSGTINYSTGELTLEFSSNLRLDSSLTIIYSYPLEITPDTNSEIRANYYCTGQILDITEAGFYNQNEELVAYCTFPPIEFHTNRVGLNLGIAVDKSEIS